MRHSITEGFKNLENIKTQLPIDDFFNVAVTNYEVSLHGRFTPELAKLVAMAGFELVVEKATGFMTAVCETGDTKIRITLS